MSAFETKLNGTLHGLLHWSDWDALRQRLLDGPPRAWFVYAVGTEVPSAPLSPAAFRLALGEIDATLRRDHREDYLGIVYADDPRRPTLVKIYDPNHLGAACGSIGHRVPPGWVLSLDPPKRHRGGGPLAGGPATLVVRPARASGGDLRRPHPPRAGAGKPHRRMARAIRDDA